jgi:hypothetical protein
MAYIDPITGAYVEDSLSALPPGYNQPKAGNEANIAKMRAALNSEEALRQAQATQELKSQYAPDFINNIKLAMQRMPGTGFVQGVMPTLLAPFQLAGSAAYGAGNQIVNPETANFNKDTAKAMRALQYNPPTKVGQDISEGIAKVGEAVGPLPELWTPQRGRGFSPNDLRVLGKTAVSDIRNFPMDYANAREGLTRDYPTLGSRAAEFTDLSANIARPLAEKAYDMYMNPQSSVEVSGLKPGANLTGLFEAGSPMYAVKPKGGNNPLNMGSTLPLKEQGRIGEHLSEVQIADPYEKWLNLIQDRRGDAKYYFDKFVSEKKSSGELGDQAHYSPEAWKEKLQEIAEEYTRDYNKLKSEQNPDYVPIFSPSELQQIAPSFNAWAMNPYQKYITNQMGTGLETDPYLKEVNEANIPLHELFGLDSAGGNFTRAEDAAKRREQFLRYHKEGMEFDPFAPKNANIGKQTATTEFGKQLEDYLDITLYPSHPYYYRGEKFPQASKIPAGTVITDFLTSDPWRQTGFQTIQNRMMRDLLENKIDIDKISNRTPALIIKDIIKEQQAKQKSKAAVKKAKDDWRASRYQSIQSDVPYADGSKMQIITPKDAKTNPNLVLRDLGQSTIDLNQCIGAGCMNTPDYPGHGPYIEPHTGEKARQVKPYEDTHVKRYMDRLEQGKAEIARLLDPKGVAQATVDLHYEMPRVFRVSQQEAAIAKWLENNDPQGLLEFENNVANFGTAEAVKNAYQLYPELYQHVENLQGKRKKSISEMKGRSNGEVAKEFVPHMVEWLNKNAEDLSDVRDLDKLPGIHDLTRSYDSVGKLMDKNQHWDADTVDDFFDKVEVNKLLPRFFTNDDFALKATELGVDLSAPTKSANSPTLAQEAYEKLSEELRNTYQDDYLNDFERGDPDVRQSIITDLDSFPDQYGLGRFGEHTRQMAIQRILNEGLYNPAGELNQMANAIQGMEPEAPQQQQFDRLTDLQLSVLDENMQNYFAGNEHLVPEDMVEPYATDTRILMGSQDPEARLPRFAAQALSDMLLDQDTHTQPIRQLINQLQTNGNQGMVDITEPQAENMLNMLISWTERYPLNE